MLFFNHWESLAPRSILNSKMMGWSCTLELMSGYACMHACVCVTSQIAEGRVTFHTWVILLCRSVQAMKVMRVNSFSGAIFTSQHSSFDLLLSAYWDWLQAVHQPCEGVMSCDVPRKVGFCTWAWWSWMELNTCKQMLLFSGGQSCLLRTRTHTQSAIVSPSLLLVTLHVKV